MNQIKKKILSRIVSFILLLNTEVIVFAQQTPTVSAQQALTASAQSPARVKTPVIFDTDFGPDYDDVGAIALLHAFADSGYIDILATGASCDHKNAAAALSVFNTYFSRPSLPVGIVKGKAVSIGDWQHWTDTVIAHYPHNLRSNEDAPDAVSVYRQQLARQRDHSVTIITVGFFTNMANLLGSAPDNFSSLNGMELVKKKVKRLVSMAGRFPEGKEFNVEKDGNSSRLVFSTWPTPILFSGWEIGVKIHTGLPLIRNASIKNSPVKDAFSIAIPQAREDSTGRMSWDETAVLIAVKGWEEFYTVEEGRIVCAADGSNTWNKGGKGHFYIKEKIPPAAIQQIINELIQHQPGRP